MGSSRYDEYDRLQFLIDHPRLGVQQHELTFRWAVFDLEARKAVSRWHDSAREAIDDAIEHQQLIQRGLLAP